VDRLHPRSLAAQLKQFIAPFILDPDACLAEPVAFEVLRHATAAEVAQLTQQFQTLPMLATPASVWTDAAQLGQGCRNANLTLGSIDLLIAAIALHHQAEVVTFDSDYSLLAGVAPLRAKLLVRPVP
jgi:predicted nucleic acid-binding protein